MFMHTDTDEAPWYAVAADVKRHARLNCIHHLLQTIPYQDMPDEPIELPELQKDPQYRLPPIESFVARQVPCGMSSQDSSLVWSFKVDSLS